jgi:hypothetical protein
MKVLCLQTAKRSFTFARPPEGWCRRWCRWVSKPLSGRSLLQENKTAAPFLLAETVSKPLSGRSLLQGCGLVPERVRRG